MEEVQSDRFLTALDDWQSHFSEENAAFFVNKLPGNPEDCILIERLVELEHYHDEEDERWRLSTCDNQVSKECNRFEIKIKLRLAAPGITDTCFNALFSMMWNYQTMAFNRKTFEYRPYKSPFSNLPPMTVTGGPLRKIVTEEDSPR